MTCESNLRTRWMAVDEAALAPAATMSRQLDMPGPGLVLLITGQVYQTGWKAELCSLVVKLHGNDLLNKDGAPVAGNFLFDDRGPRPLSEPIPLHTKEWIQGDLTNDTSSTLRARITVEYLPMTERELQKYIDDPAYRLAVKEEMALSWSRRR